ncbi:MAG TPA: threonine/serine exporter family protein [Candidatus Baltobacteraceae bacterium]|jgi:uncharacterized membrane protein YjjP (DUF1212 family)|nr:threonine/serine exporter family protein [Candidatus Baltobacteraceae bacterium]
MEADENAVFLVQLARELHRAGVASDQLERTIVPIAQTLGLQVEIFALPTNITIAIGPQYEQHIIMLRLSPGRPNLRKLALLNEIFDELQSRRTTLARAIAQLRDIDRICPPPPAASWIVALGCIAVGVAILLGGGKSELIVAALIGLATGVLSYFTTRNPVMNRLYEVFAAFCATMIVAVFSHYVAPVNLYVSIVAGVVVLLPGYSLTLALHELANGDLIAGTARLGRVLVVLLALACGTFLGLALLGPNFSTAAPALAHRPFSAPYWAAAVVLLSIGLSVDLDARVRDFAWVFLASALALGSTLFFSRLPTHNVTPFLSALVCGLVANGGARFLRVPQPVLLVPGITVLVPGSLSYESLLSIVSSRNYDIAFAMAVNAVIAAILIVAGLLLSQLLVPAAPLRLRSAGHG